MAYLLRGRLILQGAVFVELEGDRRKFRESDRGVKDRARITWEFGKAALASLGIWYPGVMDRGLAWGAGWSATRLANAAGAGVSAIAPITAGYVIGATVGTVIANEVWGEEGAQTALGFYSYGTLPGTEAPTITDYQYIFKPTKPGGPVSAYDVAKVGVDNTLRAVSFLLRKRPVVGNPYLI